MQIEESRPHQRDIMIGRISEMLNEKRDIKATVESGGIDLYQGSDSIGWIYMRINVDRSGEALKNKEQREVA